MASWRYTTQGTKAAVASTLSSATIASAVNMDPQQATLTGNATAVAHFAAAVSAAQTKLTSLSGAAPGARVVLEGYQNPNTARQVGGQIGSWLRVTVYEIWDLA